LAEIEKGLKRSEEMGFIQDALSMFKKKDLLFLESYKETENVYTFLFEKDKALTWETGQYGLFTIIHKKIKNNTRPFSIASAPTENVVRITTTINAEPSDFKKALLELKPGMRIRIAGPVGSFSVTDNIPSLLIAGGMGITPFRAILKQIEAEENGAVQPINLLYLDSNNSYIFKNELDEIANNHSIHVTYLGSRDDLHKEIDKFTGKYKNEGKYFVAGPKSMVESISSYLQKDNISKRNIKKDSFFGY
jgi:ferredoxin-NADP reductase